MEALEDRGRAIGEAEASKAAARVAEAAGAIPGVHVSVEPGNVVLTGRGLSRNPALFWIGGLLR